MTTYQPIKTARLAAVPALRWLLDRYAGLMKRREERRRIRRTIAALEQLSDQSLRDLGLIRYEIPVVAHNVVKKAARR